MAHFPTPYNLPKNNDGKYSRNDIEKAFEAGAKWQQERMYSDEPKPTIKQVDYVAKKQERMYSEEEVLTIVKAFDKDFYQGIVERNGHTNKWFEQFKKK